MCRMWNRFINKNVNASLKNECANAFKNIIGFAISKHGKYKKK